jgi:uncharacterized protein DUF6398
MADPDDLRIPVAMRAEAGAIIALTDEVCADLLDEDYASLARKVVAKLARKRPAPIQSGRARTWAGAVVYALGQVNFLFDSSTKPYATADDLSAAFGVAKSTLGAKAKQVHDLTKMDYGTPEFLREDMVDANPMVWLIQVDGLLVDAPASAAKPGAGLRPRRHSLHPRAWPGRHRRVAQSGQTCVIRWPYRQGLGECVEVLQRAPGLAVTDDV